MPREDYPPKNIADMMSMCESLGRTDLAHEIRVAWVRVLNEYPKTRINWPTANVVGNRSIKKNVFKGQEFTVWLQQQKAITGDEQKKSAQQVQVPTPPPKDTPSIAIPRSAETPESWHLEADKTKQALAETKKGFSDAREFVDYLEREIAKLKKAIATYGEGGDKSKTKSGDMSKMSAKIPKWKAALDATADVLEETKRQIVGAESTFKTATQSYHNAPITTETYEKKVQKNLDNVLDYISKLDLSKQRDLLAKLEAALKNQKESEEVTSRFEVDGGLGEKITALIDKIRDSMKDVKTWLKGIKGAIEAFSDLATLRY